MSSIKKSAFSVFRDKGKSPAPQESTSTDDDHPKPTSAKRLDSGFNVRCIYHLHFIFVFAILTLSVRQNPVLVKRANKIFNRFALRH